MTQETHDQLPLKLIDQFSYSPERFVVHSGIKEIVDSFEQISIAHKYSINFIFGQECVGKTHLSIYMAKHGQIKVIANLISGKEFGELIEAVNNKSLSVPEVLVVDDVDAYLNKIQPDHSGAFVTFIELCRRANSRIFLLSSTSIYSYLEG